MFISIGAPHPTHAIDNENVLLFSNVLFLLAENAWLFYKTKHLNFRLQDPLGMRSEGFGKQGIAIFFLDIDHFVEWIHYLEYVLK